MEGGFEMVLINNIRKHKFDRQKPTVPYPHQGVAGDRKKAMLLGNGHTDPSYMCIAKLREK